MLKIKTHLIDFIWNGINVIEFVKWIYEQDSVEFEKLIGEDNFIELVIYNYDNKSLSSVKKFIKTILPENLILEFEKEFLKNRKTIKGVCIKNEALGYGGDNIRKYEVEIGKEYEFLIIRTGIKNENHEGYINYINFDNDLMPSGFIPISLFKMENLDIIPEMYIKTRDSNSENYIEPIKISKSRYIPTEYSFWEDYYNHEKKALKTYVEVLEELGIKKVW